MKSAKAQVFDKFYDVLQTSKDAPAFAFSVNLKLFNVIGIDSQKFIDNFRVSAKKHGFLMRHLAKKDSFIIGFYKPNAPEKHIMDCMAFLATRNKNLADIESCCRV